MTIQQHNPIHPGEFIKRVYLDEFDIGSNELARQLHVSSSIISRLLNGKSDVSPAMALKLSKVLGRSPESWLQMQDNYDLWQAKKLVNLDEFTPFDFASKMAGNEATNHV
ncbi:HigA family addiction module antitoxin [Spartinivicinus marinus]|uniref:HigA family addiction module antitoxin n=1 Tax=Spartinivicinus marinus TaxID=2994442 RepID=UPI001C5C8D75|nr:HigA family addiction module antitoxin [Spartinivicinus marinus]